MIDNSFNITSLRFHILNPNTFIVQGWFKKNNVEQNKIEMYLDSDPVNVEVTTYSGPEIRRKYLGIDFSVDTEYSFSVEMPENYTKSKDLYIYMVKDDEKRLVISISTNDLHDLQDSIPSCIDSSLYDKKSKTLTIKGWAVSTEPITIKTTTLKGEDVDQESSFHERLDVIATYTETAIEANCGFEIKTATDPDTKLIVHIKNKDKETIHMVTAVVLEKAPKEKIDLGFKIRRFFHLAGKGLRYLRGHGLKATIQRTIYKLKHRPLPAVGVEYQQWRQHYLPTEKQLEDQSRKKFSYRPKYSIVVPLYKTPKEYLDGFVESILNQTYDNWELCLSDGSGPDSPITELLNAYVKRDKRIKVVHNEKQLMISENTNAAMKIATGDFFVFADHDDLLSISALYECTKALNKDQTIDVIYSDEDKIDMDGVTYFMPHFKPDFNIDLLRTTNYISHLFVARKSIADQVGYLNPEFNGSQDYDFILRCIEKTNNIYHIPKVLYHWRAHADSTAENPESKLYAFEAGKRAVQAHFDRVGLDVNVEHGKFLGMYKSKYKIHGEPLISIVIPNKDHIDDLDKCIQSIEKRSNYRNYEYIIVENNSTEQETFDYYKRLETMNKKVRVVRYKDKFNYSLINNYGVSFANGDYILLLNNDTEIINEDCLEELLGVCMREDVGIVGARLFYEDDTIQHAGAIIGAGGIAGHTFIGNGIEDYGYFGRVLCMQDYSAVTAACMMVKKSVFDEVGGLSPELAVAFNDIDFCLKVRSAGKLVVYNPYATLYHYESKSRGLEDTPEKVKRFNSEIDTFARKWSQILEKGDPYYNPNFSLDMANYTLKRD